jgi:hypothetical protein
MTRKHKQDALKRRGQDIEGRLGKLDCGWLKNLLCHIEDLDFI